MKTNDRKHPTPPRIFGLTGELADYMESLNLNPDQRRRIGRAIAVAKQLAARKGRRIDSNEAMGMITRNFFERGPRPRGRPSTS